MHFSAKPVGKQYGMGLSKGLESTVIELVMSYSGLRIVVATHSDDARGCLVEYTFYNQGGFRVLDEGDLLDYWRDGRFEEGYHLFQILCGGWADQERESASGLSSNIDTNEWFVCTTNLCVNVLSGGPPLVRAFGNYLSNVGGD